MERRLPDLDVLRSLVEHQWRPMSSTPDSIQFTVIAAGWDNLVARVDAGHVARFPLHDGAARLVEHEAQWLDTVAAGVLVPVPKVVWRGRPGEGFTWPWLVCRWVLGEEMLTLPRAERAPAAAGLAQALLAIHRDAPPQAPPNPYRGVDLSARAAITQAHLSSWSGERDVLGRAWSRGLEAPRWPGRPQWIHGDLHPRNLTVDPDGVLAGMLDFGDLTSGDPATDLAAAWLCFDAVGRARFQEILSASGRYDEAIWVRAAGWAAALASAIAGGGDSTDPLAGTAREVAAELLVDGF